MSFSSTAYAFLHRFIGLQGGPDSKSRKEEKIFAPAIQLAGENGM
jgi:hypothetical protein